MITRNNLKGGVSSTAVYSDCEHYRYSLRRVWEPKKQKINLSSVLGNNTVLASVYVLTKKENISVLKEKINCYLEENGEVEGGVSILPNNCGLGIRILSNSSEDTRTTIYQIAKIVRKITFTNV